MKFTLLKQLCEVHAPSGEEGAMTAFLLKYIKKEKKNCVRRLMNLIAFSK